MKLNKLYDIAERENIDIYNYKMNKTKARIIEQQGTHIFIDYSQINSYSEEKCLIAEELGHYFYHAYYSLSSSQILIDKQEYKAMKYSYNILIPFEILKSAVKKRN